MAWSSSAVPQATIDFFEELRPTEANSTGHFDPGTVAADAAGTRVVVHARYPALVEAFLAHKRAAGSARERHLYHAGWTWRHQVARLLAKRPLAFLNGCDNTLLRDGSWRPGAAAAWDRVGADEDEDPDLRLADYLSYDEILLGSLLGVSGPSHFINDGARRNRGRPGAPGSFEPRGVIVGLVGARFERPARMDSLLAQTRGSRRQRRPRPGRDSDDEDDDYELPAPLRAAYARFLDCDLAGPHNTGGDPSSSSSVFFNAAVYEARVRVTAELLLAEAAERAAAAGTAAHVYVVGLGLGVWLVDKRQPDAYAAAFAAALAGLAPPARARVARVEFAWLEDALSAEALAALHAAGRRAGVDVVFSRRNPAAPLDEGKDEGETDQGGEGGKKPQKRRKLLLVLSYAWDGNAFPGNEYWVGSLDASGDPAAACMSTIGELHNPLLNPGFLDRIAILGPWGGAI